MLAGGLRGAALLVMLIVLPLVAPAIIFGAARTMRGQAVGAELALLGAMLAVAPGAPAGGGWASAAVGLEIYGSTVHRSRS